MQMYNLRRRHSVIGSFTKTKMLITQFQKEWILGRTVLHRLVVYTAASNIKRTMPIVFALPELMQILEQLPHRQILKLCFTLLHIAMFTTILVMKESLQLPKLINMK